MTAVDTTYCARCGADLTGGDSDGNDGSQSGHAGCAAALELEPPRYCPQCRRRMVVQVTPGGWSARCVEHGTTSGSHSDATKAR